MVQFNLASRTPSIIFRAVILVTLACVALLSLDIWRSFSERETQINSINAATSNLARATEIHASNALDQTSGALAGMVERVENDGTSPDALTRLHSVVVREANALPQVNGFFVYDQNGAWIVSTEDTLSTAFNNADRAYFEYHKQNKDSKMHVGDPIISRSSGKWVLPLSRRLEHADGSFAGVALATIDLNYFLKFYQDLDTGHDGVVSLFSSAGKIIIRFPHNPKYIGRDVTGSELFRTIAEQGPVGSTVSRSDQDGVKRFVSYRKVGNYPLIVQASLSQKEQLTQWMRDTAIHTLTDIIFISLLIWLGRRMVKQMEEGAVAQASLERAHASLSHLNTKLERQALFDGLTGLANRRHLDATLVHACTQAQLAHKPVAIILIDLDCFKQFNDTYGHLAGDDCLTAVAAAVQEAVASPDALVARYGGEEIVVVLPEHSLSEALSIAERARSAVYGMNRIHHQSPFRRVTISAGVCSLVPKNAQNGPALLLKCADQALYRAKSNGRNRVERDHPRLTTPLYAEAAAF